MDNRQSRQDDAFGAERQAAVRLQQMDRFPSAFARQSLATLSACLILAFSSNAAFSAESCERLVALANQYAGVELTGEQKQMKRKMVVWYSRHCVHHATR